MDTIWWVVIAVAVAVILLAVVAQAYMHTRRRSGLRDQFGPEYERAVGETGSRRKAEKDLAERERAREELDIRPLTEAARERHLEDWQRAESRFVDDPELAAREADSVVRSVLQERGYPSDYDEQAAAVSVDHPHVVERYRHGHQMVHGNGASGDERTENLRKAMVDFRAVFEQLVEDVEPAEDPEPAPAAGR
jgi:hypothetical protein